MTHWGDPIPIDKYIYIYNEFSIWERWMLYRNMALTHPSQETLKWGYPAIQGTMPSEDGILPCPRREDAHRFLKKARKVSLQRGFGALKGPRHFLGTLTLQLWGFELSPRMFETHPTSIIRSLRALFTAWSSPPGQVRAPKYMATFLSSVLFELLTVFKNIRISHSRNE